MDISERKIIFIHIPKSIGSSAREFFIDAYGKSSVAWMGYDFSRVDLINAKPDFFNKYKVVGGHFSFELAKNIPGEKIYVSVYRHVTDRIISLYRYIERTKHHHLHETLNEVGLCLAIKKVPTFRAQISDLQTKFLSDGISPPSFENAKNNVANQGFYISNINAVQELFETLKNDLALPNTLKYGVHNNASNSRVEIDSLLKNQDMMNDLNDLNVEDLKLVAFLDAQKDEGSAQGITVDGSKEVNETAVVLLHVPKTGGTTLHDIMLSNFDSDRVCPERFNNLSVIDSSTLSNYRFFSGHYDWDGISCIPGDKKVFTLLRNPRERILSLYHFWRSHKMSHIEKHNLGGPRLAKTHDLYGFLCLEGDGIPNNVDNVVARTFVSREWYKVNGGFLRPDEEVIEKALDTILSLESVGVLDFARSSYQQILSAAGFNAPDVFPRARDSRGFAETPTMEVVEKPVVTEGCEQRLVYLTRLDDRIYAGVLDTFYQAIEPSQSISFSEGNVGCSKWLGDGWVNSSGVYGIQHHSAFVSFRITESVRQIIFHFIFDDEVFISDEGIVITNHINGEVFKIDQAGRVEISLGSSGRKQFGIVNFELEIKNDACRSSLKSWAVGFLSAKESG